MSDPEVLAFYASGAESERLQNGIAQLEAIRTRQLLLKRLPAPPCTVMDVGGGTGAHAFWLAERGYAVHLLDPVGQLVDMARARNANATSALASIAQGDALSLPHGDATADAVLILGPLYHLTTAADRLAALAEAHRVLRSGGVLFAMGISRWAGALYGLQRGLFSQNGFQELVDETIDSGQNRNPLHLSGGFTTAYYHRPEELVDEVESAGFDGMTLHGLEGPACTLSDFDQRWSDPHQRRVLEWSAATLGDEPTLLGVSAHLLAIGRRK